MWFPEENILNFVLSGYEAESWRWVNSISRMYTLVYLGDNVISFIQLVGESFSATSVLPTLPFKFVYLNSRVHLKLDEEPRRYETIDCHLKRSNRMHVRIIVKIIKTRRWLIESNVACISVLKRRVQVQRHLLKWRGGGRKVLGWKQLFEVCRTIKRVFFLLL